MNLSAKEKISYGIGAVGKDMVYMLTASYILYYYEDILGVSAVFTGILLLAARVFDAANDPVMGILVARTKSRFGKFRPWLLSGTLLNALVLYAMFAVPEKLEGNPLLLYISAAYILWGVTYTMMDIPYWSMIPAFARDSKEREGLSALGRTCAGVGSALVTVITMPVVYFLGNENERIGFKWFALIVAVFFAFTAILMCLCIKEKSTVDMPVNSIGDMFRALLRNEQAMTVVVSIVLINCSIYLTSNLVIYFFKYDFGGEGWYNAYTLFNTFGGAVQILSMMLLYPLIRKFLSTVQVFRTGLGMAVLGYAVLLLLACTNMSSVFLLFIPGFFIFGANGLLTILTTVFLANSVDYGQWKNGIRDESVIFSMQTFVVKLASGVAVLMASICLAVFQISENTEVEAVAAAQSVMGLRLTMTVLPVIGLAIAAVFFSKKFKLTDEKMAEIGEELGNLQSAIRNATISKILYLNKSIEQFGSGFKRINSMCRDAKVKYAYEVLDTGFTFIFYRKAKNVFMGEKAEKKENGTVKISLNKTEQAVYNLLERNPYFTRQELVENTSKSLRTIQRTLDSLREKKLIERIGGDRFGHWEVKKR